MKIFHKVDAVMPLCEGIDDLALAHRKRFGEAPAIGINMEGLYRVYKQVGGKGSITGGGKVEPLKYAIMTPAGVVELFEDATCPAQDFYADDQRWTVSIDEPTDE